MFNQTGNPIT